jgi:hypothetical protein
MKKKETKRSILQKKKWKITQEKINIKHPGKIFQYKLSSLQKRIQTDTSCFYMYIFKLLFF